MSDNGNEQERETITLYRALTNLDTGRGRIIEKGDVFFSNRLTTAAREKLEKLGRISYVSTPPLSALPDWDIRAKELSKHVGIATVEDLLNSDADIVAERMGVTVKKLTSWKTELLSMFVIPRSGDGGCVAKRNLNKTR